MTYLVVPPLATGLSVLAAWRLLGTGGVDGGARPLDGDGVPADGRRSTGPSATSSSGGSGRARSSSSPSSSRSSTCCCRHTQQPTWRQLVFLAAAGAAGVGLTSTATFLVPLLAVGCLAPLPCAPSARPRRNRRRFRVPAGSNRRHGRRRAGGPARTWSVTSSRTRSRGSSWAAACSRSSPWPRARRPAPDRPAGARP